MSEIWINALRFAALPGAAKVRFERQSVIEDGTSTTRYALRSEAESGRVIGDDRDYDLLKSVMGPLEKLAEQQDHRDLIVELDLINKTLTGLSLG
ncbi:MAG: hypothetical protein ABJH52_13505 [Henriciella sp.]